MRSSVKYAKVSCKRRNNAIQRFSTKLVEMTMPDQPSYATALKLAEALKDLGYALEACDEGKKAGIRLEYSLEMRICRDTVSHQLTREKGAAEMLLLPAYCRFKAAVASMQAIIKFALSISLV
jgi:hypothetical protein